MDYRVIHQVLQAVPFQPFRLRLADGREFEVPHRDFIAIGLGGRMVTHYDRTREDAVTILEPLLIITIEYPSPPPPATVNGPTPE